MIYVSGFPWERLPGLTGERRPAQAPGGQTRGGAGRCRQTAPGETRGHRARPAPAPPHPPYSWTGRIWRFCPSGQRILLGTAVAPAPEASAGSESTAPPRRGPDPCAGPPRRWTRFPSCRSPSAAGRGASPRARAAWPGAAAAGRRRGPPGPRPPARRCPPPPRRPRPRLAGGRRRPAGPARS